MNDEGLGAGPKESETSAGKKPKAATEVKKPAGRKPLWVELYEPSTPGGIDVV